MPKSSFGISNLPLSIGVAGGLSLFIFLSIGSHNLRGTLVQPGTEMRMDDGLRVSQDLQDVAEQAAAPSDGMHEAAQPYGTEGGDGMNAVAGQADGQAAQQAGQAMTWPGVILTPSPATTMSPILPPIVVPLPSPVLPPPVCVPGTVTSGKCQGSSTSYFPPGQCAMARSRAMQQVWDCLAATRSTCNAPSEWSETGLTVKPEGQYWCSSATAEASWTCKAGCINPGYECNVGNGINGTCGGACVNRDHVCGIIEVDGTTPGGPKNRMCVCHDPSKVSSSAASTQRLTPVYNNAAPQR